MPSKPVFHHLVDDTLSSDTTPQSITDDDLDSPGQPLVSLSRSSLASSPSTDNWSLDEKDCTFPLDITWRTARCTIPVPQYLYYQATCLRDSFFSTCQDFFLEYTEDLATDNSSALVVARWLEFLGCAEQGPPPNQLLDVVFRHFESDFLSGNSIHVLASCIKMSIDARKQIMRSYFIAKSARGARVRGERSSALLQAAASGVAKTYAIFGGQGNASYFQELRLLYEGYPRLVGDFIVSMADHLSALSKRFPADRELVQGLDLINWLQERNTPNSDYLVSAPISLPLVGLLQLAQYSVTCKMLDLIPGEFVDYFRGVTGHSQGIIVACAVAASGSWLSFVCNAQNAITTLFIIGLRCQQTATQSSLESVNDDIFSHDDSVPSPMLSIRGLSQAEMLSHTQVINSRFANSDEKLELAIHNGPRHFVVAGPVRWLHVLYVRLANLKAKSGQNQGQIPYSKRKLDLSVKFLPITAPFHHSCLESTSNTIDTDLQALGIDLTPDKLRVPVFDTISGRDIRSYNSGDDLIPSLVRMVTTKKVNWDSATLFPDATHIVDFGPGGVVGIGSLTALNKEGTGARVIFATALHTNSTNLGTQAEIFDYQHQSVIYNDNWAAKYRPRLVRLSAGKTHLETKLSTLLSLPPIMVGGMTPTTRHVDFVAATMAAGYYVELAGGGHHTENGMADALRSLASKAPPGRGIAVNVLYVNPRALKWQISLVRKLIADGVHIDGLTIGGGVPSLSVATEYIETIGLKYIAFKPATTEAILAVVDIAKHNPEFPVILQWTGGQAGGHHSGEDLHEPILKAYGHIRKLSNISLVIGGGFGGWEDSYPYLTGQWSVKLGFAAMPFDGVLLGSRMMTVKEAHTSPEAKNAIVETPGTTSHDWEKTYSKDGGGGVLSVISEMGQPIHKLATRGVRLWAELDKLIFNLPKSERLAELYRRREYIISRLNVDFQKVWFGVKDGEPAELSQMTVADVLHRLIELMYVKARSDWIHPSYGVFVRDFLQYVSGDYRVGDKSLSDDSKTYSASVIVEDLARILAQYPVSANRLMSARDIQVFLNLCQMPGRKPVPFVPILDEHFETYFKKDSLWQSEDLEAVVGRDVGRTCILHGPVAARHSSTRDQSVSELLNDMNDSLIKATISQFYDDDLCRLPEIEYFYSPLSSMMSRGALIYNPTDLEGTYWFSCTQSTPLPTFQEWIFDIAGGQVNWLVALLTCDRILLGEQRSASNVFRQLLAPTTGLSVSVDRSSKNSLTLLRAYSEEREFLRIMHKASTPNDISVEMLSQVNTRGECASLQLRYRYDASTGYAPIREIFDDYIGRVRNFYQQLWLKDTTFAFDVNMDLSSLIQATFYGKKMTIEKETVLNFSREILQPDRIQNGSLLSKEQVPLDLLVVMAWDALVQPLFLTMFNANLLKLVHLSNSFRVCDTPLQIGDDIQATSQVTSVLNQSGGKLVEITCAIRRAGVPAVMIASQFLIRGKFTDHESTFTRSSEAPVSLHVLDDKGLGVLKSRSWLNLTSVDDSALVGRELKFAFETVRLSSGDTAELKVNGSIYFEECGMGSTTVGTVQYHGKAAAGNPVDSYLERHGTVAEPVFTLEQPITITPKSNVLRMPDDNTLYAYISGDVNAIHLSDAIALYSGLPGKITHGMYSSAVIRALICRSLGHSCLMRSYRTSFIGTVFAQDELHVNIRHVGMVKGRKLLKFEATKAGSGNLVVRGEAEIEQPLSAYVFTGQGSQEVGMGMDLYASSKVAAAIWDRADAYLTETFGYKITDIVRNNPKELQISFASRRGRQIRARYIALMELLAKQNNDNENSKQLLEDIGASTLSYTFRHPSGLLHATQFAQPALTLVNKARYEDMRANGLIPDSCFFAGHSLGEYSALTTFGGLMSVEELMSISFYRGLAMRGIISSDNLGRTGYSMSAVNPSKVASGFSEEDLSRVVNSIVELSGGWMLEIVNYNVENQQYICAGELRGLQCVSEVLDQIRLQDADADVCDSDIITDCISKAARLDPLSIELQKTPATIPLRGLDIPFHSSLLLPGVDPYRDFLKNRLTKSSLNLDLLIDRWIPNVTGKPFGISRAHFEDVFNLTGSPVLSAILQDWPQESSQSVPERA